MFPPETPSTMRDANNIPSPLAKPSIRKPTNVPSWLINKIGRRPYLSDRRPNTGAPMNCISEYDASSRPMVSSFAPKDLA